LKQTKNGLLLQPKKKKETLEDLVAKINKDNLPEYIDWGPDVGREIIQ
jgi:antitoxin component of MazEF toxin-antitoxin module